MGQKFEFLTISSLYVPYISATAKIEAYKQRMKLFDFPCRNTEICPPWKSCLECEWRVCVSSTDALVLSLLYTLYLFYHYCYHYYVVNKDFHCTYIQVSLWTP